MRYLQTYSIFEKSSLNRLGVPTEIIQELQYNYEIESNANWERINLKKDVKKELMKDEISMFIEINNKYIQVYINLGNNEYIRQYMRYDDYGWGVYDIHDREDITRTQLLISINSKSKIYKLEGDFQYKSKVQRKVQKELKEFDETTKNFKMYIMENFNKIIKRLYGKRYEGVMKQIAQNIKKFSVDSEPEEILKFLKDNEKLAQKAKEYEKAKGADDLKRIKRLEKQYNSLPVLDEYLINFEEEYSNKYNTRLTIKDLIEEFGRMKIETAFMYYLYTDRIKELSVQKTK